MKKRLFTVLAIVVICAFALTACGTPSTPETSTTSPSTSATDSASGEQPAGNITVAVLAKGFQHQFWKVVSKGAEAAASELGATVTFDGPPSESDIDVQVNQLNAALAKNPSAIALAALDTESVIEQLNQAKESKIPIIGFDSGVPNAPEGTIFATASTDNKAAAAIAAEKMMENQAFLSKIQGATAAAPVTVGIISQDATSASIKFRTEGYITKLKELIEAIHPGGVAVTGHSLYEQPAGKDAIVTLQVSIPPTTGDSDMRNAAEAVLNIKNLIGVFCSNEGSVGGFLNATTDGSDLAKGGRYENLVVAGFDAGATQKNAVRQGWFIGSVTQDPYNIGYKAVELAVKAAKGETVSDVDTGAKWYNAENIDNPDIAELVYD